MSDLRQAMTGLAEVLYADGIVNAAEYIPLLGQLLAFHEMTQLPEDVRWQAWRRMSPTEMMDTLRERVIPVIAARLGDETLADLVRLIRQPKTLVKLAGKIDDLPWGEHPDLLGDAFESLLAQVRIKGIGGHFRTPSHLVRFIVEALQPRGGERFWDPASGTGSFLWEVHAQCPEAVVLGSDIDRHMVRVAALNAFVRGMPPDTVRCEDTLKWALDPMPLFGDAEGFDGIVANPPFGARLPSRFVPGLAKDSKKSEVQFLGAILQRLKPGGRAGVIVPAGFLFDGHAEALRRTILETCRVRIVALPPGVFQPYTNVATAVLFLDKTGPQESIWFYSVEADGLSLTAKRQPVEQNDLPGALEWLRGEPQECERAWCADTRQVISEEQCSCIPSRYQPREPEEVEYESPEALLTQVYENERDLLGNLAAMASLLDFQLPHEGQGALVERWLAGISSTETDVRQANEEGLARWLAANVPVHLLETALAEQGEDAAANPAEAIPVAVREAELHLTELIAQS